MSTADKEPKQVVGGNTPVPPYLSYKTFKNFLDDLKVGIPMRIDRSVLHSMSGAVQSQLMTALRYLGLTSANGVTTEWLPKLVNSEGAERQQALSAVLMGSYSFLFVKDFDLQRATTTQIEEAFKQAGASGDTVRKCVAFFVAAAKEAGIAVSPHIKASKVSRGVSTKAKPRGATSNGNISVTPSIEPRDEPIAPVAWSQMLLAKFPSFDPAWSDEVKAKWFDAFDKLMKQGGGAS